MAGVSIYLLIMVIFALLLFVVLFLGDFDVGDVDVDLDVDGDMDIDASGGIGHGPSAFSLPVILSIGTAFGAFGVIFEAYGWDPITIPVIAMILAIGVGVLVFVGIWKMFKATESTTRVNFDDMIGLKAVVSIPIRDGAEGQIVVTPPNRGRMTVAAMADYDIERDEPVRIVELIGDVMKVKRIGPPKKKKGQRSEVIKKKKG